jgi:putative oxidoreductase
MLISGTGIVLIHAQKGWFVGEHGTGGVEYSIVLFVACVVLAAADRERGRALAATG